MNSQQLQEIKSFAHRILIRPTSFGHGLDHIERVTQNALWIVEKLKIKNIDLNLLEAACYLHDLPINSVDLNWLGPIRTHFLEKRIIKNMLPEILDTFPLDKNERNILFNAIYSHPFSQWGRLNRTGDIYSKILQDADTMDAISRQRINSYKVKKATFYFKLAVVISGPWLWFFRKFTGLFLNFPELAKEISD